VDTGGVIWRSFWSAVLVVLAAILDFAGRAVWRQPIGFEGSGFQHAVSFLILN